jgi:hypothetical protein
MERCGRLEHRWNRFWRGVEQVLALHYLKSFDTLNPTTLRTLSKRFFVRRYRIRIARLSRSKSPASALGFDLSASAAAASCSAALSGPPPAAAALLMWSCILRNRRASSAVTAWSFRRFRDSNVPCWCASLANCSRDARSWQSTMSWVKRMRLINPSTSSSALSSLSAASSPLSLAAAAASACWCRYRRPIRSVSARRTISRSLAVL